LIVRGVLTNGAFKVCDPDGRISHFRDKPFICLSVIIFHSLASMPLIVGDRSAILVYAYLALKASLLINAAFRRSRIVNIDG
jgi:hypothetical protein